MDFIPKQYQDRVKEIVVPLQKYQSQIIVVVCLIISGFIAKGVWGGWEIEREHLESKQKAYEEQQKITLKVDAAEKKLKETVDQLLGNDFFELKDIVEQMVRQASLKLISLKPGAEIQFANYKKMEVVVSTRGDYGQLVRLMSLLEKDEKPVQLESLNVTILSGKKEEKGLNIEFKIAGYAKK